MRQLVQNALIWLVVLLAALLIYTSGQPWLIVAAASVSAIVILARVRQRRAH